MRIRHWMRLTAALTLTAGCSGSDASDNTVLLAVATSLTAAMEEAAATWEQLSGVDVEVVAGASSTLARQIENGAPYGVFVTAHSGWMDSLVASELVDGAQVVDLAHNGLVVVASTPISGGDGIIQQSWNAELFATGRWAFGDPEHVPAGVYAKQALESIGAWGTLEERLVPAPSARSALRLVERREVDFGVIYRTDAACNDGVVVIAEVPPLAHDPARVSAAPVLGASASSHAFAAWLGSVEVRTILRTRGFQAGAE